jgi:uncharacterized protein (DUF1330 family)
MEDHVLRTDYLVKPCTAFEGAQLLAAGPLIEVVLAVKNAIEGGALGPVLVFDDTTGHAVDFDLRGSKADVIARLSKSSIAATDPTISERPSTAADAAQPRGRGRPKLGVVGREVTLLPRQWEWLATQQGGASVVLRKLVNEAKRSTGGPQKRRAAQEAAYHFMSAMAGDMPGFEEAKRALFANDRPRFEHLVSIWPEHVRTYAQRLAFGDRADEQPATQAGDASRDGSKQLHYLEPTPASGGALIQRAIQGEIVMLNLLRFRSVADYSHSPHLAPAMTINGAEAYDRYIAHTMPYLIKSGGALLFSGDGGQFLIGPEHERWDRALLVRQSSVDSFMAFATEPAYLAGLGHRTAALEDSRLLPLIELSRPF